MGIKMLFTILFVLVLFLAPQAEAHIGNPCLPADYTNSICVGEQTLKPASDHVDSTRLYDQEGDADHRHKIRAIGVPGENYDKTHLEDDGLGTEIASIPIFDRDYGSSGRSPSPCYEIDSDRLGTYYTYTHRRNPHPFADEGMAYPTLNPPHNVSVIAVEVNIKWAGGSGPGLDYETASVDSDGNHYYDYTITAWDAVDEGNACDDVVNTEWQISETFRLYVTDVDETLNYPPLFDREMEQMAVFENADPGVEICCGIVDVSDRDTAPEDLVYSLGGPNAAAFRIITGKPYPAGDGLPNGFIYATRAFDYERKNRYEVTARVEDLDGLFLEHDFTIHVVDVVNEGCSPPHFPGNGISPFDVRVHLSNTDSNGNIRPYDDGNCAAEPPPEEDPPIEEEVENTPPPVTTGRTSPPANNPPSGGSSGGGGSSGSSSGNGSGSGSGSSGGSGGGGGGSSLPGVCGEELNTCDAGTLRNTPDTDDEHRWSCRGESGARTVRCTQDKPEPTVLGTLENPGSQSFQSGIGVISGWACEADEVVIELDGEEHVTAYGTERLDTLEICGDTDNGFGLLFNWNRLDDGEHVARFIRDGAVMSEVDFTVTTLGEEFLRAAPPGVVTIDDWPSPGETVTLEWQQSVQNFVITDVE